MKRSIRMVWLVVLASATQAWAKDVEIRVDGATSRQRYEGFGATTLSLVHTGPLGDALGPTLRPRVLDALYSQVRLTMGNLAMALLESPGGWDRRRNDNDDPQRIDWTGFDTFTADHAYRAVARPGGALGLNNYSLEAKINWNTIDTRNDFFFILHLTLRLAAGALAGPPSPIPLHHPCLRRVAMQA